MPGFERIDNKEKESVSKIFDDGGVLFAHGFDKIRKNYHVREFEEDCKNYFKSKYSVAVSSGTAAIKTALKASGVKRGDEVITQAFNFIATIEAILDCGAIPKICSVNSTLNMDVKSLKKLINKRTKVILPVHMLGVTAEMTKIKKIAKKFNLIVVEDNCEAVGSKYNGTFAGSLSDVGILSFDHGKMITTGEGGLVLSNKESIGKYCREYIDHGHENNKEFPRGRDTKSIYGFNYRMTEIQGAIGKIQLKKLDKMIKDNKERYNSLEDSLNKKFKLRKIPKQCSPSYDTLILFENNKERKSKIIKVLNDNNFGTKNLPDAMEWHCSYFWDHALPKKEIINSVSTKKLLDKCVAIPIWLKKSVNEYQALGKKLSLL